ncbi:MAG: prephenate dehydratase domain-containing protein [Alphaproteobacteria bacterium]
MTDFFAPNGQIAIQGLAGSFSDTAVRVLFPQAIPQFHLSFEDVLQSVRSNRADMAIIPVENTLAGRLGELYKMLAESGLYIVGEYFQPIRLCLLGLQGSTISSLSHVHSHKQALSICRTFLAEHGIIGIEAIDTSQAAQKLGQFINNQSQNPIDMEANHGVIASFLAGRLYGLELLKENIAEQQKNFTRFLILSTSPGDTESVHLPYITTLAFRLRHEPASLYRAITGFATRGVNLLRLESHMFGGRSAACQFSCDLEGHGGHAPLSIGLEELSHIALDVKILGIYPAAPYRKIHIMNHNRAFG